MVLVRLAPSFALPGGAGGWGRPPGEVEAAKPRPLNAIHATFQAAHRWIQELS
jgi:hypothetical protein